MLCSFLQDISYRFASCSSDDDEVINTTILTPEQQSELSKIASESSANANKTEMGKVVANYINEVVKPTYLDLAEKSDILIRLARICTRSAKQVH